MRRLRVKLFLVVCVVCVLCVPVGRAQGRQETDARLESILARVGQSVERYHGGLFSVRFTETLVSEELKEDFTPKRSRLFVYDGLLLREELSAAEGDYVAATSRRLRSVDGKPRRKGDAADEVSAQDEYLNILLPKWQKLYQFTLEGEETFAGRKAFRIGVVRPGEGEPRVEWEGTKFRVLAPTKTMVWVDAESFDVMQMETKLVEPFEFQSPPQFRVGPLGSFGPTSRLRYEREESRVRFGRVQFKDPEQTLLLPLTAEWLRVIRGASRPRVRTRVTYSDYRRFVSGVKVVEEPDPNE